MKIQPSLDTLSFDTYDPIHRYNMISIFYSPSDDDDDDNRNQEQPPQLQPPPQQQPQSQKPQQREQDDHHSYRYQLIVMDHDPTTTTTKKKKKNRNTTNKTTTTTTTTTQTNQEEEEEEVIEQQDNDNDDDDDTTTTTVMTYYGTIVFIIPMGRHDEYTFRHPKGIHAIAQSAHTFRIIMIRIGNNHHHHHHRQQRRRVVSSLEEIQSELLHIVQYIHHHGTFIPFSMKSSFTQQQQHLTTAAPSFRRHSRHSRHGKDRVLYHPTNTTTNTNRKKTIVFHDETIPFMTYDGTIGKCHWIHYDKEHDPPSYWIEQVDMGHHKGMIVRRLYFASNPMIIQSEVAFIVVDMLQQQQSQHQSQSHPSQPQQVVKEGIEGNEQGIFKEDNDDRNEHLIVDGSHIAFSYHKMSTLCCVSIDMFGLIRAIFVVVVLVLVVYIESVSVCIG
jgi:hypothetical protein